MKTHKVAGGEGVQLHVVEAGNPGGRPILFIHGARQSWLAWSRQLDSELARDHRLVAMDPYLMLGYNVSVPPHVRQALLFRVIDNDDLLPRIRKPVLITQGAKDAIVKPEAVDQHKVGIAHAQIHIMPNAGHAPFWEDSFEFNHRLLEFVEMCCAVTTPKPVIA